MLAKTRGRSPAMVIGYYLILTVIALGMIYPFYYMVSTALKTNQEATSLPITLWPSNPRVENFIDMLNLPNLPWLTMLLNTTIVAVLVTIGTLFTSMTGGYAFARLRFPGREQIFLGYLASTMIPFVVLMVPMYQIIKAFHWIDKLESLIIPWIFSAYGTFLFRQFFKQLPTDLEEAALIDGASRWTILWRIFVPLSGPIIATQATFTFLYAWNSFLWPLVVIHDKNKEVITLGLVDLQNNYASSHLEYIMAGATFAVLPTILVYFIAQRWLVEGIQTTGMKG